MENKIRNHLGHVLMDCMRQHSDAVYQIDAATGEEETCHSVLSRSIRLAKCFRKFGLKPGDVLSLGGRNHLDVHIPFYAALFNGMPISGVDPYFKLDEVKSLFNITTPKIAFCQQESYDYYTRAVKDIGLDTKIITFDGQDNNLQQFIETYNEDDDVSEFKPVDLDTNALMFLISTSGTTGGLKVAAFTHEVVVAKIQLFRKLMSYKDCSVRTMTLLLSPVQWVTAFLNAVAIPLMNQIKLQTSRPDNEDHIIEMINKYKPISSIIGPAMMTTLLNRKQEIDLTCFRTLYLGGSKVLPDIVQQLKPLIHKDACILEIYGLTEMLGVIICTVPDNPLGSCGVELPPHVIMLMDPESDKEITSPYVTGELWVKGPAFTITNCTDSLFCTCYIEVGYIYPWAAAAWIHVTNFDVVFTEETISVISDPGVNKLEYLKDPQATAAASTVDGFCKSGDLFYRDENNFYYYVDRIKSLIKYKNSHVIPVEIEAVILTHPSVRAVCVCGVTHKKDGQHAAACIELRAGCRVTEQEIKDLVNSKLSKNKQLHGGVLFVDEMPMTSSGKIARGKVLELLNVFSDDKH